MNKASIILVILLVASVLVNVYLVTRPLPATPNSSASGIVTVNLGSVTLSPGQGFYRQVQLNGTALVTGKIIATAPINFDIAFKGNVAQYAFKATNSTVINVWVPLAQGPWSFDFVDEGVNASVTADNIYINYSYFG